MTGALGAAVAIGAGYLVGAIPVGVLVARLAGSVDPRQVGSRRTGSTNALRAMGLPWAVLVLALDIGKGLAAVLLAGAIFIAGPPGSADWVAAGAGVAAIVGHNWSIFIGLGGGRGVATAGGALLGLAPAVVPVLLVVIAAAVARWRFVSLGSITAALLAPPLTALAVAAGWAPAASIGFALAAAALLIWAHADNIARLRSRTERRLGEPSLARKPGREPGQGPP